MTSANAVGAATIDRLLHRDPVASVFSGNHSDDPASPVTITVGHERVDGSRREVFLEWASRLAGATTHPHLSNCATAGLTESGRPYMAFQTTRRTLTDLLLEGGPLPTGQVRAVGVALADALAHYHHHGLIHGAVQPSFILVGRNKILQLTGYDNTAPVLARPLPASVYTAPEHLDAAIAGEVAASPASDVYALGSVLYTALGGVLPWARPESASITDPLTRAAPVGPIPGVSRTISELLAACLSSEPQQRPSASDLASSLSEVDIASIPVQRMAPVNIPNTQLPQTGLRPVTVNTSTELEISSRKREPDGFRRRLRKVTTGTAGLALTGALLGGVALATYAATNTEEPPLCPDETELSKLVDNTYPDGEVVDRDCGSSGFITAYVETTGGSGGGEETESAAVPIAWQVRNDRLERIRDCTAATVPEEVKVHLECAD